MVAITANGLYGDRARGLFGFNQAPNNGSATSSTSAQAVMEKTYSSIAKLASDSISSNKATIDLLRQQVALLKKMSNKDGLGISDLLIARYLGKFAAGAAAAVGGVAARVGGIAGAAARTITGGVGKMFTTLRTSIVSGIGTVIGSVASSITNFAKPMLAGIRSLASFASFGNATKMVSNIVGILPKAIGLLGKGLSKLFLPLTAIMGVFDGIKGAFNADEILGRETTMIEKIRTGLAQVVNGFFLGLPDWLSEKAGFKNFAVFNDKVAEASRNMQEKIGNMITDGLTSFTTAVSDGFTSFKNKLAALGEWARNLLSFGPAATPEQVKNAGKVGNSVGGMIGQMAGNPPVQNKSSASDVKNLMMADRLDKIKENMLSDPAMRESVSTTGTQVAAVTGAAKATTTAAVTSIGEVAKQVAAESIDSVKEVEKKAIKDQDGFLKKIFGSDIAEAFSGAIGGLEKAAGTLQGDLNKSIRDAGSGVAAYLGGNVQTSFIGNGGATLPGGYSGRGGSSGGGGASGSFAGRPAANSNFAYTGLGSVAEKYESGGRGVGTISSGSGDAGGVSYGKHQLATNNGSMAKFLKSSGYDAQFAGLQPGTKEFNDKYSELAKNDPKFGQAQSDYIKSTHYDVAAQRLKDAGMDMSGRGKAVQEAIFSTAVQYGPNKDLFQRALAGRDVSKMSDEEIISAVQSNKRQNVASDFRSSPRLHSSLVDRMTREESDLLGIARGKTGAQGQAALGSGNIIMANQGKTRDLDIKPELKNQLEYAAAQSGVKVEVTSGGQGAIGTTNKRTGSTRHDEGGAADLKLYRTDENGKKTYLDMNNPADAAIMKQFTTESVRAGATGVGAGYMGGQTLHIGGGSVASWGGASWVPEALKEGRANPIDINKWVEERDKKAQASAVSQSQQTYAEKMKEGGFTAASPFGPKRAGPSGAGLDLFTEQVSKELGQSVGKAITEEVKAPKTPEFVPSITTPLQQAPSTPANSAVAKNPTGAPKDPVASNSAPDIRSTPSIDEYSMLLPNSTMMA